jgi:hypothetical protein
MSYSIHADEPPHKMLPEDFTLFHEVQGINLTHNRSLMVEQIPLFTNRTPTSFLYRVCEKYRWYRIQISL